MPESKKPLFLITNDDGYFAPGLQALAKAVRRLGRVAVVAPDREQSATGHSLTLHAPLRVQKIGPDVWSVSGTPTDCVNVAILHLLSERPAMVLSGINAGSNLGNDVTYSGTVAAAMEGLALGVPSIAISYAGRIMRSDDAVFDSIEEPLSKLLAHLTTLPAFPPNTLLNVNLPSVPAGGHMMKPAGHFVARAMSHAVTVDSESMQPGCNFVATWLLKCHRNLT